jgi:transposase
MVNRWNLSLKIDPFIALESTGIYRIAVWDLLHEMGFKLTLVG